MATCQFPYIEKLAGVPAAEKQRLTNLHLQIAKTLKAAEDPAYAGLPLYTQHNGYFRFNPNIPTLNNQQLAYIKQLNTQNNGTDKRPVVFATTIDEKDIDVDGSIIYRPVNVVGIDVRPLINPTINISDDLLTRYEDSTLTGEGLLELEMIAATDLAKGLKDFFLQPSATGEYNFINQQHADVFRAAVEDLKVKLSRYLELIRGNQLQKPAEEIRIGQIAQLLKTLDNLDDLQTIEAVSNFIIQSSNWLDGLSHHIFGNNKKSKLDEVNLNAMVNRQRELNTGIDALTGKPLTEEQREFRIRSISQDLFKTRHYLYLFNNLEEFQKKITLSLGYAPKNTPTFERGPAFVEYVNNWLNQQNISAGRRQMVNTFLQSPYFTSQGLRLFLQSQLRQNDPYRSADAIDIEVGNLINALATSFPGRTTDTVLNAAINKSAYIKSNLIQQHQDLVKSWIWPRIQEKQKNYTGQFKVTENQVVDLLKLASEDDSFFTYYMDTPTQSKDPITAIIAGIVSDAFYESVAETRMDLQAGFLERSRMNLDKTMTPEQIRQFYDGMTHNVILRYQGDEDAEAGPDWTGPTLDITVWSGETIKLKGYYKKAFLTDYNTSLAEAHQLYFYKTLSGQVKQYTELLNATPDGTIPGGFANATRSLFNTLIANQSDPYQKAILERLFYFSKKFNSWVVRPDLQNEEDVNKIYMIIKRVMNRTFLSIHFQSRSNEELTKLYSKYNVLGLIDQDTITHEINGFINRNSTSSRLDDDVDANKKQAAMLKHESWYKSLVHYTTSSGQKLIYVRKIVNNRPEYSWVNLNKTNALNGVTHLYYNSHQLIKPNEQYNINNGSFGIESKNKYDDLKTNQSKLSHYEYLYNVYEEANHDKLTWAGLTHGVLPQVMQENDVELLEDGDWDKFIQWIRNSSLWKKVVDLYHSISGVPTPQEAKRGTPQYLNNESVQRVPAKFIHELGDTDVERDLFRSVMMYKAAANKYRSMRNIHPQIQAVKTLINGDTFFNNMTARQVHNLTYKQKVLGKIMEIPQNKRADRLNTKLTQFLNDNLYGESTFAATTEIFGAKIDLNKLGSKLSAYTALTTLALNFSSMFSNVGVGFLSNLSEAVRGQYYSPDDWRAAFIDYSKNLMDFNKNMSGFIKDLNTPDINKHSIISQLVRHLDAFQGEIQDEQGNISTRNNSGKIMKRALLFTQSGAEHMIQTISMIAQMRGFKLATNYSLWDDVGQNANGTVYFKTATDAQVRAFQQQLHSVNKRLHGHYSQMDKALIQRYWLGQLAMMFKKYIYSSVRYRFGSLRYDWEAGDETEGHLRAFWKNLWNETKQQQSIWMKAAILGNGLMLKPIIGGFDQLTAGGLGKLIPGVTAYAYGDEALARNAVARQTSFDLMCYMVFMIMASVLHALDDDDDDDTAKKKVLNNLEVFARRMEGDLGMYLPGIGIFGVRNALTTYDKTWQMVQSPLAQLRTYNQTVRLFSQLVGFENTPEGIDFSINDRYTRSGPGYEKGDLKIEKLLEKSVFSPYYQLVRLFNPKIQMKYMELSRRNSN